ncbi:hypothetical protein M446_6974 (plasmid) [Methylobacterium sp. 4-46]|nr:hypothetical protein M446_6974 [Methylobacterium sp. 4-46]
MIKAALLAASLALLPAAVLAQGGSPYNKAGSQAGGPVGGAERAAGAPGGTPDTFPGQAKPPGQATRAAAPHRAAGHKAVNERRRRNARD